MELRARTEKLAEPRPPTAMPPVTKDTALISGLENDTHTHRFLRGVMCFLLFLIYMFSVFQIDNYAGTIVLHVIMLLLTLAAEVCLYFIYRIKARFTGFTNPAVRTASGTQRPTHVSVLHSPYLGRMCLEMLLWLIQCPPGVPAGSASNILDSFIVLRTYVFVMYLSQLSSRSVFKRAIGTLCGVRFDSSFVMRYNFLYHSSHPFMIIGFVAMWACLSLLHAKAETKGFGESLYFCFNTATFVGYGDFAPRTFTGRVSAFFSLGLGLVVLAWFVAIMHNVTKLSVPEKNMHNLFHTNKLCAALPGEAARVIQRSWKLYVAKKEARSAIAVQFNAFWLTAQAASFRTLRRQFAAAELSFLRSTFSFEDALTALTPASSRATSPATSPRGAGLLGGDAFGSPRTPRSAQKRPYSMFQTVKSKESLRTTPRAAESALTSGTDDGARRRHGGTPSSTSPPAPTLTPVGASTRERTQAPTDLRIHTGFAAPDTTTAAASANVLSHMQQVDAQLDELIRKAERLSRNWAAAAASPTELAS